MSTVSKTNGKSPGPNNRRSRRKKRRTEDFSSDSESSSSSENESEKREDEEDENKLDQDGDAVLFHKNDLIEEEGFQDTKRKLQTINLTKTDLNNGEKNTNLGKVSSTLKVNRKELENKYLELMFENYGNDINELRNAPDFNTKRSLSILANVLKNGSNIFDQDTLKTVVDI